jgi:hypothetical protein
LLIIVGTFVITLALLSIYYLTPVAGGGFNFHLLPEFVAYCILIAIVPTSIVTLGLATKAQRQRLFKTHVKWFPSALGILALLFFQWYARSTIGEVDQNFFSTSAQVIPVLILALTVDVRFSSEMEGYDLAFTILAGVVGEVFALGGTADKSDEGSWTFGVVVASIVTVGTALIMAIGAGSDSTLSTPKCSDDSE